MLPENFVEVYVVDTAGSGPLVGPFDTYAEALEWSEYFNGIGGSTVRELRQPYMQVPKPEPDEEKP